MDDAMNIEKSSQCEFCIFAKMQFASTATKFIESYDISAEEWMVDRKKSARWFLNFTMIHGSFVEKQICRYFQYKNKNLEIIIYIWGISRLINS